MVSESRMYDELGTAFRRTAQSGRNWDALAGDLRDLSWFGDPVGYLIEIEDASDVLIGNDAVRQDLVEVFRFVAEYWAEEVDMSTVDDHPAVPFRILLTGNADRVRETWGWNVPVVVADRLSN